MHFSAICGTIRRRNRYEVDICKKRLWDLRLYGSGVFDGIHIRQNWKPEVHYTWDDFEQMYIKDQCIMLHLNGRRYGFSQGCPNAMELIEFLEQKFSAEQAAE